MENKPRSRKKNVTGTGNGLYRRGEGLNAGAPTSGSSAPSGGPRPSGSPLGGGGRHSDGSPLTRAGGKASLILIVLALLFFGGKSGFLSSLLGLGSGTEDYTDDYSYQQPATQAQTQTSSSSSSGYSFNPMDLISSFGMSSGSTSSSSSSGWSFTPNTGKLDRNVNGNVRDRYTNILGNGKDTVTIMVYVCGTDLESRSGMATQDLTEMTKAKLSDNVNLIVLTGGCKQWKNNIISNRVNQIYQVKDGGLYCLEKDYGTKAMTDPSNITDFIKYCTKNYPANRNMFIFWDHGGGSISGYGYDEKNQGSGSMNLAGINSAFKNAGAKFDFVGFDTCLMATLENDILMADYADYIVASEETEPGVGWYYTDWLTALSKNTSMPTIEIGKNIIDDFTDTCERVCPGQKATLSIVDLAELSATINKDLKDFSKGTTNLIKDGDYSVVSNARSNSREFAVSNKIDQIDLYSFARNLNSKEGDKLAKTILNCVKYNRTSDNMTDSYGISIYFPYRKTSKVNSAIQTYDAIGIDSEYSDCIREFAGLELSGQAATGGMSTNPLESLLGGFSGQSSSSSGGVGLDSILSLVSSFTDTGSSSSGSSILGLASLLTGRSLSDEDCAKYISEHYFDTSNLVWKNDSLGQPSIFMDEEQWKMVHSVDKCMFIDDGTGYIDLGLDNVYDFGNEGNLIADTSDTWLAINNQVVAYYHLDTVDDGTNYTITGYVPAFLNGERVKLIIIFDNDNEYGYIAGALPDYEENITETIARGLTELNVGDTLDFVCNYYKYDMSFDDQYLLGEQMTVTDNMVISDVHTGKEGLIAYKFTDLYNQSYWTETLK